LHPAYSIIVFTTASGAGYGLLSLIALCSIFGWLPLTPGLGFLGLGLALALASLGLISSTLHLGRPERAWRAFSQWRSSWLSREGVAALATYAFAGPLALVWMLRGRVDGAFVSLAIASAVSAFLTVVCTGMIYQSLKPIPQWRGPWTVPAYLALAALSGALLLVDLALAFGAFAPGFEVLTIALAAVAAGVKCAYWRRIDSGLAPATLASATGLGRFREVRLLDAPHTEANFVMREMGYRIARKHALKLRRLSALMLFAAPAALMLVAMALAAAPWIALLVALVATLSAAVGLLVERWLFFAEATHHSMIYYDVRV
jgi:DMSO reductase anchor subunit